MIDRELIEASSLHLQNIKPVEIIPGLYKVENVLYPPLFERLLNFIQTREHDWEKEQGYGRTIDLPRSQLTWLADSPVEEVHTVIENYTKSVNKIFDKTNIFDCIQIWKDLPGFKLIPHTDNPIIDVGLQIYLSENPGIQEATTFYYRDKVIKFPHKQNSGYLMDNSKKILHDFNAAIPENDVRFSLHAIWIKS